MRWWLGAVWLSMAGCTLLIEAHDGRFDAGGPSGDGGAQDASPSDAGGGGGVDSGPVLCVAPDYELEVHPGTGGSMSVVEGPEILDCPENTTCNTCVPAGTELTLIPTPKTGYQFGNWSTGCAPDCVGMNPCVTTMPTSRYVCLASFTQ